MRQFRVCDSVEAYGLEKALDKACIDLDRVDKMSDTEACAFCNTDTKEDGKSSVSCPLKPSDSAPLKHSTMPP